jgi:hypothetical protein
MLTLVFQSKLSVHMNCRAYSTQESEKKYLIKMESNKILSGSSSMAGQDLLTWVAQRQNSNLHKVTSPAQLSIPQGISSNTRNRTRYKCSSYWSYRNSVSGQVNKRFINKLSLPWSFGGKANEHTEGIQ